MSAFGFIYHRNKPFKYVAISDQLVSTVIYQFDRQSFFGLWLWSWKKGLGFVQATNISFFSLSLLKRSVSIFSPGITWVFPCTINNACQKKYSVVSVTSHDIARSQSLLKF